MSEGGKSHSAAYFGVFAALIIGTITTVLASRVDMGRWNNIALGLAIAIVKASLVGLIFMHLKFDKRKAYFAIALVPVFLVLLLLFGLMPDGVFYHR